MAFKSRRVSYTVFPSDYAYRNGVATGSSNKRFYRYKTQAKARRKAFALGPGSTYWRNVTIKYRPGRDLVSRHYTEREWEVTGGKPLQTAAPEGSAIDMQRTSTSTGPIRGRNTGWKPVDDEI